MIIVEKIKTKSKSFLTVDSTGFPKVGEWRDGIKNKVGSIGTWVNLDRGYS